MLTKVSLAEKIKEGLTVQQLADYFECSTSAISRAKRRFGLSLPKKAAVSSSIIPDEELKCLVRWGFTNLELAEFYGCSVKPIKQKKKELGLLGVSPNCKVERIKDGLKKCLECNTLKPVKQEFYYNKAGHYYSICKSCYSEKRKAYYNENKEYYAEKSARYRASVLNAVPDDYSELDDLVWKVMRQHCKDLENLTGVPHEIDHIIPISKGGLHHRHNWQILTAFENRSKGNKIIGETT